MITREHPSRRTVPLVALLLGALLAPAGCGSPEQDGVVRLDQVGYAVDESKIAFLLTPRVPAEEITVDVVTADGRTVMPAHVGGSRGAWNASYRDVRAVDLSGLREPGTYRLRAGGSVRAESPPFRVGDPGELFGPLAGNAVRYFQAHRDGADQVPGVWARRPAHRDDASAQVYERPAFDDDSHLADALSATGDRADVEGGWYDAGDFLKFTHTTAYAVIALLLAARADPADEALSAEARHGLDWLAKMWDADSGTLYTQVGIGSGRTGEFLGDHDSWRLPEADDRLDVRPGDDRYYQRYRPVFRAAAPGEPLSPNLAGRVAAAFALAARAATDPDTAAARLETAARIYDQARTEDVGELVTAEPRTFYPEDRWADDLALAATELGLAAREQGDSRAGDWLREAAEWARINADGTGSAALSVYDVSMLADAELAGALTAAPVTGAAIDVAGLHAEMRRRLDAAVTAAAGDPLGAAAGAGGADYAARQLGYAAAAQLYARTSGDNRYAAFATAQRGVVLGANGWGTSLVIGAGTVYPRCPHDQIAALTRTPATTTGMTGGVVNGPNAAARVDELLAAPETTPCGTRTFAPFDRPGTRYADDTRVSATTEPSIDFTAAGLLAFALTARPH